MLAIPVITGQENKSRIVLVRRGSAVGAVLNAGRAMNRPAILLCKGSILFNPDAIYSCRLESNKASADDLVAAGVWISSKAQIHLSVVGSVKLSPRTVFTLVRNNSGRPICGRFANLPDGLIINATAGNKLRVSYEGGDGNDLTLTVVP